MSGGTTLPVLLGTGDHTSRPAAADVGKGGLYACTTHALIYQTDGSSWTTWATLGTLAALDDIGDVDAPTPSDGDVLTYVSGSGNWESAAPTGGGGGGAMTLITDTVMGSDTASFDFTSIPGTYKHLRLIVTGRSTRSGSAEDMCPMRFNNDSGSNYDMFFTQSFSGSNNGSWSEAMAQTALVYACLMPGSTATANLFGQADFLIPDYASTAHFKTFNMDGFAPLGTSSTNPRVLQTGGTWKSTSAITRVTLYPANGNWLTGSRASLFGIS